MTDSDLQLLINFRSEVAEPDDETARRIYALATVPATPSRSSTRPRARARTRSRPTIGTKWCRSQAFRLAAPTRIRTHPATSSC